MKRLVPEAGLSYNSNSFSCQCAALVLKKTVYCLSHVTLITYVRTAQKKLGTLERMFHLPSRTLGECASGVSLCSCIKKGDNLSV